MRSEWCFDPSSLVVRVLLPHDLAVGAAEDIRGARRRRDRAARKHRPSSIDLLLVAESPPCALDRYFYFEDVGTQDGLFRNVVQGIMKIDKPRRDEKPHLLRQLAKEGVFLIDLRPEPVGLQPWEQHVPSLIRKCKRLSPRRIILIKSSVYKAAYEPLRDAGLRC